MDFHCHLDLYSGAREVYREAAQRNEFTWLVTTSPKAFAATLRALPPAPSVLISPGLHPEIAHERAAEIDLLLEQMASVKAVGEVGLDGSPRFRTHYEVQRRIFRAVLARSAELGGRTLSIHSRRAVKDVLADLDAHAGYGTAVLHWFSGNQAELRSAIDRGCWFSIGPAMLDSENGRRLADAMPRDRVVPESDGPFAKVGGKPVMPWSASETAQYLSAVWKLPMGVTADSLASNGAILRKTMGA